MKIYRVQYLAQNDNATMSLSGTVEANSSEEAAFVFGEDNRLSLSSLDDVVIRSVVVNDGTKSKQVYVNTDNRKSKGLH